MLKLTKHGPNTITSKNALRVELEQVPERELAVNDQELARGHAVAVRVRWAWGEVVTRQTSRRTVR